MTLDASGDATTSQTIETSLPPNGSVPDLEASIGSTAYFAYTFMGATAQTGLYTFSNGTFSLAGTLAKVAEIDALYASSDTLYVFGKDAGGVPVIDRFDPATRTETLYATPTGYRLNGMTVSPSDQVSVGAVKFSDSSFVVGTLDSSGNLAVTGTTPSQATTMLELQ